MSGAIPGSEAGGGAVKVRYCAVCSLPEWAEGPGGPEDAPIETHDAIVSELMHPFQTKFEKEPGVVQPDGPRCECGHTEWEHMSPAIDLGLPISGSAYCMAYLGERITRKAGQQYCPCPRFTKESARA